MKKIFKWLFPQYSKWHDIEVFDKDGFYKLIQMRYRLDNNKKQFRIAKIAFINDYRQKPEIYKKVLAFKNEMDITDLL